MKQKRLEYDAKKFKDGKYLICFLMYTLVTLSATAVFIMFAPGSSYVYLHNICSSLHYICSNQI